MKIEKGRRVTLKIELAVYRGDTLEKKTVEYIHGGGAMLAGLEKILDGLEAGAKKEGVLKAKDAFGSAGPIKRLKKKEFPGDVEVGNTYAGTDPATKMNIVMRVEEMHDDGTLDIRFLHPLADKDIEYKLEVVKVSDPAPPPLPAKAMKLEEEG